MVEIVVILYLFMFGMLIAERHSKHLIKINIAMIIVMTIAIIAANYIGEVIAKIIYVVVSLMIGTDSCSG